ncbi:MAG: hypothetical protein GY778_04170, partial [bacterium]|nr:hypothetical protein [bacterium]
GTISLTEGLNTVTGVSTNFTSAMTGRTFRLRAGTNARYIFTYVGASSGTLDRVWEEAAVSAVTYEIYQAVFELPAEVKYVTEVLNPHTLRPLQKKSQRELNEIDTARRLLATPRMWAPGIDTPHASPPVMHTLELYPAPVEAKGYPYVAQQATYSFDGSNTSDEPLPWISRGALIERCKALILEDEKDYNGAAIKERRFQDKLNRMGLVEAKRKGPRHLQLDPTWTSHYRARGFK